MSQNNGHSQEAHSVLVERIENLSNILEEFKKDSKSDNNRVHHQITKIAEKQDIQNSYSLKNRLKLDNVIVEVEQAKTDIGNLKLHHQLCPGAQMKPDFEDLKEKTKPIVVITSNWKMIMGFVFALALFINIIPGLLDIIQDLISRIFPFIRDQ